MRDDPERLRDILEAVERIEKYAAKGREAFEHDELIQVWIVHHLQLVGEAARSVSADFRAAHPEIPWPQIVGMRNILVHNYFGIDTEIVWAAVERDLPALKAQVKSALGE
jgi:uncharacterized protein with HEPN domain